MKNLLFAALFVCLNSGQAQELKPVPELQVIPLPDQKASVLAHGKELTRYHFGESLDRPFFYPLRHPGTGLSLTRMGHPHDPEGHSHHNSVWISHHKVDGLSFWLDGDKRAGGKIRHERVGKLTDGDDSAEMETANHWMSVEGKTVLLEKRKSTVTLVPESLGGGWMLELELRFSTPRDEPVTFEQDPFGVIGVRLAKTIGVNDGGGRILNSEGAVNEEAVFRKPARWVDYSGRVTAEHTGGITLFDAPENPGHPSPFHVRNDGWMGICLSLNGPVKVEPEKPLVLRYGLWMHDGMPGGAEIGPVWKLFSEGER